LGIINELKDVGLEYKHFIIPKSKYFSASHFYKARIIHYINSDLDSARAKFGFREKFDTNIFDKNLATKAVLDRYQLWEKNWTREEGMPSDVYYEKMWKAVQKEKNSGGNEAEIYYKKASVLTGNGFKLFWPNHQIFVQFQ
jgi:hypothetical protein